MKTVGMILRETREGKKLTLSDVEKGTRIRSKFLDAIEHDDYTKIPSSAYAKGFVKNYSEFLGLDSKTLLAFFRRQTEDVTRTSLLPKRTIEDRERSLFQLTPSKFIGILFGLLFLVFISYFVFQYVNLQRSPAVSLEKPLQDQIVEDRKIEVIGKTNPDATVTINGVSALVRTDGKFYDQISLDPGVNTITVIATSRFGKSTTLVRKIGLKQ